MLLALALCGKRIRGAKYLRVLLKFQGYCASRGRKEACKCTGDMSGPNSRHTAQTNKEVLRRANLEKGKGYINRHWTCLSRRSTCSIRDCEPYKLSAAARPDIAVLLCEQYNSSLKKSLQQESLCYLNLGAPCRPAATTNHGKVRRPDLAHVEKIMLDVS